MRRGQLRDEGMGVKRRGVCPGAEALTHFRRCYISETFIVEMLVSAADRLCLRACESVW